ncbi:MAG: endolytic transglycosylase MltG [Bacteroidota bacterium]
MSRRTASRRSVFPATAIFILLCMMILALILIPIRASQLYGRPTPRVGMWGIIEYSARLLWDDGLLTRPRAVSGSEQIFNIDRGEAVGSIAVRLQSEGLISSASAFRDYVVYTGLDTSIQAGKYKLTPAMSAIDIAHELQDATPEDVTFVVLPGWRAEEVAASLPTSGLSVTAEDFLSAAASHPAGYDFFESSASAEGFLYPDTYILPRTTDSQGLVDALIRNFALHLSPELREGFARHGLSVYQGVTLASIVQREAVEEQEQPIIASVFLNRLNTGMKLDSDPTVQYALGYNAAQRTWWTNPLNAADLQFDSPFNTYLYPGLPPRPIANPGASALRAVAFPAQTPYYYFRARCDNSGLHIFAETFDEHMANGCP